MFQIFTEMLSNFIFLIGAMQNTSFLKPLPPEKEALYISKMSKGDKNARDKLIEHNLRLVAHIVKKYDIHKETQDLISIGTIGLIKAIDSYKIEKGKKLTTYASRCIENEILMYLRSSRNHYNTLSLDEPLNIESDGNGMSILDTITSTQEKSIIDKMALDDDKKKLLSCFFVLDEKEKDIIEKRYGMNGQREYKQKEIAQEMHISRSYVSRIEKRALMKLYRAYIQK